MDRTNKTKGANRFLALFRDAMPDKVAAELLAAQPIPPTVAATVWPKDPPAPPADAVPVCTCGVSLLLRTHTCTTPNDAPGKA